MHHDIDFSVPFRHRVRFTRDLAGSQPEVLLDLIQPSVGVQPRVLLLIESQVAATNQRPEAIESILRDASDIELVDAAGENAEGSAVKLPGSEDAKNSELVYQQVLELIHRFDLDRRSYVVVVGGGALLDVVGLAAAVAHRGIRLIRIPTTTLAQADSGVGVKNSINFFGKKNWLGTFAVPWGVINDLQLLDTLPDRDFGGGFSEAVKVSLLKSPADFEWLCENATRIRQRDWDVVFDAIQRSCLWHLQHITEGGDPFEALEARPLDFGHWSAHRLESLTNFELRHGEAVGLGVALDCIYSMRCFGFPEPDMLRVVQCLSDLGLPRWHPQLDNEEGLLEGLEEFRQHLGGRLTVTMLEAVGQPIDVHEIDDVEMRAAVRTLHALGQEVGR